jgi:hypothetical protein
MYDAGEDILAHSTFTGDEYAEVGGCHLDGFVYGKQQLGVVADYAVSLFYGLYVHGCCMALSV